MTEEENVAVDNSNTTEEEVELDLETEVEETIEEVKARLAKAEEVAQNYKVRAEKAERKAKGDEVEVKPKTESKSDLSIKDAMALMANGITLDEDIEEASRIAKIEGKSVAEVLKDPYVKGKLEARKEERTVAQATNTGSARRGSSKVSDEKLLENASKGILPESDEDFARLYNARKNKR